MTGSWSFLGSSRAPSIRSRLIRVTTAVSLISLLLATGVLTFYAYESRQQALRQELQAMGAILSANLEASLVFVDRTTAGEVLASLASRQSVIDARVSDMSGNDFASHGEPVCRPMESNGYRLLDDRAVLAVPIRSGGDAIGRLHLCASLEEMNAAVGVIFGIAIAVMFAASLLAWALATVLAREISRPIEHLADTMGKVATERDFSVRVLPSGEDETAKLMAGFNTMINDVERYSLDLADARDRAQSANESKTRFLASMSHELRTPLNAIMGFSEIIRDQVMGDRPAKYRSYAADIYSSAKFQLALIDDLLDMSRLDSHGYILRSQDLMPSEVLQSCIRMVQSQADGKSVSISTNVAPDAAVVSADNRGYRQVLINVLGNAVKFTPSGGRIDVEAGLGPDGAYMVRVSDTGIGISPEDLDRVKQPFEQVDSHLSREHQGAGLGLAISNAMMELHGGRLDIESTQGEGTTISIVMPMERVRRETGPRGLGQLHAVDGVEAQVAERP